MPQRSLTDDLKRLPPTTALLAIAANAGVGYYAGKGLDLASDLEGANLDDEAREDVANICENAKAGDYESEQSMLLDDDDDDGPPSEPVTDRTRATPADPNPLRTGVPDERVGSHAERPDANRPKPAEG